MTGFADRIEIAVASAMAAGRDWSRRRRRVVLPAAALALAAALGWAVSAMEIGLQDLRLRPLLLNLLVLTPLAALLNGAGIAVSAWAHGRRLGLGVATGLAATGTLAEVTPAPGALAAHGGALMAVGVRFVATARFLAGRTALFAGLAAGATALSLPAAAPALLSGGGALAVVGVIVIWAGVGAAGAAAVVAQRALSLALQCLRIWCAFAALGVTLEWTEPPLYAAAGVLGSFVFIAPGGLGVSEALAALAAALTAGLPAAAFAATAMNRVLLLAWSAPIAYAAIDASSREPRS